MSLQTFTLVFGGTFSKPSGGRKNETEYFVKTLIKKFLRSLKGDSERSTKLAELTDTQAMFCQWNAERLGISVAQSEQRYRDAWAALPGGHRGKAFRQFCDTSYHVYRAFFDENQNEVFDTYQFHGHLHFLRMVSYRETALPANDRALSHLLLVDNPVILDFGCGLAAYSRKLCAELKRQGKNPRLVLADIPTPRRDFLLWLGEKTNTPTTFLECTANQPIPDLPPCNLCIALEVFEHLHDPLTYLDRMHEALAPGGMLITNVENHKVEFMHVSPNLEKVRSRLHEMQYEEREMNQVFLKPAQ